MSTNIQVRSVDEQLARAAKARAAASHRSLSDYVKALIERDLTESRAHDTMQTILDDIARDTPWPVERLDVARALEDVRRDMSTG